MTAVSCGARAGDWRVQESACAHGGRGRERQERRVGQPVQRGREGGAQSLAIASCFECNSRRSVHANGASNLSLFYPNSCKCSMALMLL
jgi:hypothetical protein